MFDGHCHPHPNVARLTQCALLYSPCFAPPHTLRPPTHYRRHYGGNIGSLVDQYGRTILDSLPPRALVVSATDVNWNALRYLQVCEGQRPDVTHISLQLMPFPWFPRQHHLYPGVTFPPIPKTASTTRGTAGNRALLGAFIKANYAHTESKLRRLIPPRPYHGRSCL
jgi:hypothetical protein